MAKPHSFIRSAPAGWHGQAFGKENNWLNGSGKWCSTPEEAERTLVQDVEHQAELTRGRIERMERRLRAERELLGEQLGFLLEHIVVLQTQEESEARFREQWPNFPYAKGDPRGPNPTAGLDDPRYR